MRTRTIALAVAAVIVQALGSVTPARAADPTTVTFLHTGAEQTWTVPAGVTAIQVVLTGGRGGTTVGAPTPGGAHRVAGELVVSPGQLLYVEVGGHGSPGSESTPGAGGFNGGAAGGSAASAGAGGGGSSDLRTLPRLDPASPGSRLIVAGGSGGSGGSGGGGGPAGGAGGSASAPGGRGGQPGTSAAGGIGGTGTVAGSDGAALLGGAGGGDPQGGGGGGGAGGYFGGGGGGAGGLGTGGGGGGGGSSYTGDATNVTVGFDDLSTPMVAITYDPGSGGGSSTGTVDAVVTMASSAVCLELSTSSIDFGTRRFGEVGAEGAPSIGITNCGGVTESILARGTHAVGADGAWALVASGSCVDATLALDQYRLRLFNPGTDDELSLTTTNQALDTMAAGSTVNNTALMDTPCPGSSGAGGVVSMQILFTAIEEVVP
ncbi:MAG TPA: hypothetical protein VFX65_08555 [Candidatus Limnocylindrales bacterium]|nr:hypothetical protein [Candidatus Limnocylindrales bacterium]